MADSGLILPDSLAPVGERTLALPESTRTLNCLICGEMFLHPEKYHRHVPNCAGKNRETLITVSEEHQAAIDDDPFQKVWDPEALEWIRNRQKRLTRG